MTSALLLGLTAFLVGTADTDPVEPAGTRPLMERQDVQFARSVSGAIDLIEEDFVDPVSKPRMAVWAVRGLYAKHKKPLPPPLARRLARLEKAKQADIASVLQDAYAPFADKDTAFRKQALDDCLSAVFLKLEPGAHPDDRSCFYSEAEVQGWIKCRYLTVRVGVGVKLKTDPKTKMLTIVTPYFQGPAYKAGLRSGDVITHITVYQEGTDREGNATRTPEVFSTKGMSVEEAYKLLLGKRGTTVSLKVIKAK
jgi:hypothetical protein